MLNISESVISLPETETGKSNTTVTEKRNCCLFYQTTECFRLLEETLLYEGFEAPVARVCTNDNISDAVAETDYSLLFIEVTDQLMDQALRLRSHLSHDTRVVLIGHEDSISTLRAIEDLGFYYLLWSSNKQDIAAFLHTLRDDQHRNRGPQQVRAAMRVAVVGLKGGSGCTMAAAELAYGLAEESHQQVIVVDHGYTGSNMHIMLGKRDLLRQPIGSEGMQHHTLGSFLDQAGSQSQLSRVEKQISYLGFELGLDDEKNAAIATPESLREYTNNVLKTLQRDANFIVEDYSASTKFYPHPRWLCSLVEGVVLVVQPSLSGLHETRAFLEQFHIHNALAANPARLILVLNHCRPTGGVDRKAVEEYLGQKIDIELPYLKNCEELLTSGKRFISGRTRLNNPFTNLSRLILGKPLLKQSLLSRLLAS